jgi:stage II sporulation protein M
MVITGGFFLDTRKFDGKILPLVLTILIIFALGEVFGALSVFQIPSDIFNDVTKIISSSLDASMTMKEMIRNDFFTEIMWIIVIWVLGTLSTLSPFISAIVAVRGFIIGFSSTFIISYSAENALRLLCVYVVPQCIMSLPVMTLFSIICIRSCMERRSGEATDLRYFIMGLLFTVISFVTSVSESVISRLFIYFL